MRRPFLARKELAGCSLRPPARPLSPEQRFSPRARQNALDPEKGHGRELSRGRRSPSRSRPEREARGKRRQYARHTVYDLNDRYQVPGAQFLATGRTYEQDGYLPY